MNVKRVKYVKEIGVKLGLNYNADCASHAVHAVLFFKPHTLTPPRFLTPSFPVLEADEDTVEAGRPYCRGRGFMLDN